MSLPCRPATVFGTVAIAACLSTVARSEGGQTPDVPPPGALDVAAELVRQRVTAGVTMCWPRGQRQASENAVPAAESDVTACDELNASLFQRREGGVLHVRTTREPRRVTELLNRSIDIEAGSDVQAIDAVMRIILKAVRGNGSAGEISSISAQSWPVTLRGGRTTFMEALDDVVRQAPGLVWLLTFASRDGGSDFVIHLLGMPGGGAGTCVFQLPPDGSASSCPP